ncbi:hypothetical protein Vadar_021424 [Vaccinium darrowii]|uniref:Uncharacterized protein n=1 Tax=Vaccinium darrowii TaxID=229202 RepID=A0ACB7Y2B8_9ERIC|nr:hypothetical protein Vadar_021424 [Vaccinium darrowii]
MFTLKIKVGRSIVFGPEIKYEGGRTAIQVVSPETCSIYYMLPNLGRKITVFTLNNDEELRNAFAIGSSKKELDILVDGGYESSDGEEDNCQNDVKQQELGLAEPSKRSDGQKVHENLPFSMPQDQNEGQGKRKKPSSPFIFFSATVRKDLRQSQQDMNDWGKHTLTQQEIGEKWNSLPEHDKQPYKEMAMLDAQQFAKEKAPRLPKPRKNRIALSSIVKVLQKLTREQREAVKSMGLGGLLELRCIRLHHDLLEWLVDKFDPLRCLLRIHGRELFLTIKEVQRLLGIHGCGPDIMLAGFSDEAFKKLCDDLKLEGGVITLTDLGASLTPSNNVTLEFKRKFVLYMLGSFLCPTSQPYVTKSYVHVVRDVDTLNGRNWAKLTLQYLANGISESRRSGRQTPNGCLFLLELFYVEHVIPAMCRVVRDPSTSPLAHWGYKEIANIIKLLKNGVDGFERDEVVNSITTISK